MKYKKSTVSLILLSVFLLPVQNTAFAWGENSHGYYGGHMMAPGYMGWFMILFWGLLLITLIFLIRWIAQLPGTTRRIKDKTPLDLLKERLARGEIEIDEYEEKKQLLSD